MKKILALTLAVITLFSGFIFVFADDSGSTVVVNIDNVDHDLWYCEFCHTACGSKEAMAEHYQNCEAYQAALTTGNFSNKCEYCGESFATEASYNTHMEVYNHCKDHLATCKYTDSESIKEAWGGIFCTYNGGGCGMQFTRQDELKRHEAQCSHNGDYTTWKKVKDGIVKGLEFIINLLNN